MQMVGRLRMSLLRARAALADTGGTDEPQPAAGAEKAVSQHLLARIDDASANSLDLREKVIATVDEKKLSQRAIAKLFKVSFTWLKKLLVQRRTLWHIEPLAHGGGQKPLLDAEKLDLLRQAVTEKPDATLKELCEKIKGPRRKAVHSSTMCRTLSRLELSRKKKVLVAIEQNETKRAWHWEFVEGVREESSRLIFIDETGCNIDLVRRYGRAPKGERVIAKVPRNTPENLSVVCALAPEGIIATMALEGAIKRKRLV